MTLYDVWQTTRYYQKFYCYVSNAFDQHYPIGTGVRRELLDEDENDEFFNHLMDEVYIISVAKDGGLVIQTIDKHYNERLEEQYSLSDTNKWNILDPSSRPYKTSTELEDWGLNL